MISYNHWAILAATCTNLMLVHGPGGQNIYLNPAVISTLRQPSEAAGDAGSRHFAPGTRCVITATNGKYVPVQETCTMVRDMVLAMGGCWR